MGAMGFGILGLLFGVYWLMGRTARKRARGIQDLAQRIGFSYRKKSRQKMGSLGHLTFGWVRGKATNVIEGVWHGQHLRIFDWESDTPGHGLLTFAMVKLARPMPLTSVLPRKTFESIVASTGLPELRGSDPVFAERFVALGQDPQLAAAFLSPRVRAYLKSNFRYIPRLEANDQWLVFSIGPISSKNWERFMNEALEMTQQLEPGMLAPIVSSPAA